MANLRSSDDMGKSTQGDRFPFITRLGGVLLGAVLLGLCAIAGCRSTAGGAEQEGASQHFATVESGPGPVEAQSLLGRPLRRIDIPQKNRSQLQINLDRARKRYEADPTDAMAIIWLGRRLAYLGRYRDAIDVYARGIELHPESYRLLRHRGHRYITTRQLDKAVDDLTRAAELAADHPDQVEPDGAPNEHGIPTSTTHTNIYYHLGLAQYLRGDFEQALDAYQKCLSYCTNNDITVATVYWLFLTARRSGAMDTAGDVIERITPDMELLENHDYHKLLMLYKGHVREDELLDNTESGELSGATITYGVAMQRLINGDEAGARELFRRILDGGFWPAFGYIAAEAELAGMRR